MLAHFCSQLISQVNAIAMRLAKERPDLDGPLTGSGLSGLVPGGALGRQPGKGESAVSVEDVVPFDAI
jgi:hypothetical protein